MPCLCVAHTEEFKQRPNVIFAAMGMLAAKATHRIQFIGFKIGRAGVQLVGMFLHPRTSHVVLTGPQRCLVKPPRLECRDNRVLRRFGCQNVIGIIRAALR